MRLQKKALIWLVVMTLLFSQFTIVLADGGEFFYTLSGSVRGLPSCEGVEVKYTLDGEEQESVYSDSDGIYIIEDIPHGAELVVIPSVQTGYSSSAEIVILEILENTTDPNITYTLNEYSISGNIEGLPSCEGIEVKYTLNGEEQESVYSDSDGIYIIEDIPHGVEVVVIPSVQTGCSSSAEIAILEILENTTDQNITYTLNEYSISGNIEGLPSCEGIEVKYTLDGEEQESVYSDSDGIYIIEDIPHGAEVVVIPSVQAGHTSSSKITITEITDDVSGQNILYTINKYIITGEIRGLPSNAWLVVHYRINGGELQETVTSNNGYYTIRNVEYGSTVEIVPPEQEGYNVSGAITEPDITYNKVLDRIVYTIKRFTISGEVTGLSDIEDLTLTYKINEETSGIAAVTDEGKYTIDNVPYGATVVITPQNITGYDVEAVTVTDVKTEVSDIRLEYNIKSFTVCYSDGTTTTEPTVFNYGDTIELEANSFKAPQRMEFKEWNTRDDGRGSYYQPGDLIVMGESDITLYAIWKYTPVKIGGGGGSSGGSSAPKPEQPEAEQKKTTLTIIAVDDYDAIIYQEEMNAAAGTQKTIKAPQIKGYNLEDEETKTINIQEGANEVTFKFSINRVITLNSEKHVKYLDGYEDGEMRPENGVTRAEIAVIIFRLATDADKNTPIENGFKDVPSDAWYTQAVNYLAQNGIILGYEDGEFRPTTVISRAEFTAIVARIEKLEKSTLDLFKDVTRQYWAYEYINSAALKGWITGFPDGAFRPEEGITRAQVVVIINRMLERKIHAEDIPANAVGFKDVPRDYWGFADIMEATTTHEYSINEDGYETWR